MIGDAGNQPQLWRGAESRWRSHANEAHTYSGHGAGGLPSGGMPVRGSRSKSRRCAAIKRGGSGSNRGAAGGAFLNFVNWVGNVISPVGAGIAVVGGVVSYASGRGYVRWIGTALGLLAVSGLTRLLEYWTAQGTGGVS
jgi:hypothetical protein